MTRRICILALLACALALPATAAADSNSKIPILVVKLHKLTPGKPAARVPHVHGLAPAVPCTMNNRLDIFVDEDSILWACECEALSSGFICRWQVIGGVDETRIRGKIAARILPQRFWYHARGRYLSVLR